MKNDLVPSHVQPQQSLYVRLTGSISKVDLAGLMVTLLMYSSMYLKFDQDVDDGLCVQLIMTMQICPFLSQVLKKIQRAHFCPRTSGRGLK